MTKTFAIAAAAFAAIATPAVARDIPSASVSITDLDLTKEADQKRLERRIDNAIRRACQLGGYDTATRKAELSCRLAMQANAAPKVELAIAAARTERFATIVLDVNG